MCKKDSIDLKLNRLILVSLANLVDLIKGALVIAQLYIGLTFYDIVYRMFKYI